MKIKNWQKFQQYKDHNPRWIKIYRDLLNDPEWFALDDSAARMLVNLWLLASETTDGTLPEIRKIAFRLRISGKEVIAKLPKLSHWVEDTLKEPYGPLRNLTTETETETEIDISSDFKNGRSGEFDHFWQAYPRKTGKKAAEKAFRVALREASLPTILEALEVQKKTNQQWRDPRFIPLPTTWLNQGRWADEAGSVLKQPDDWRNAI